MWRVVDTERIVPGLELVQRIDRADGRYVPTIFMLEYYHKSSDWGDPPVEIAPMFYGNGELMHCVVLWCN